MKTSSGLFQNIYSQIPNFVQRALLVKERNSD